MDEKTFTAQHLKWALNSDIRIHYYWIWMYMEVMQEKILFGRDLNSCSRKNRDCRDHNFQEMKQNMET